MTLYAYDGASPFSLSAAKAKGAVVITGYIVGHPGGYDPISKARVDEIRAAGMGFLPNWEKGASYLVTCGKSGGLAAGKEAVAALQALSVPSDGTVAVVFSWDTYIQPAQYAECAQVADGIIEGLAGKYLFSAYGQGGLLKYLSETGRLKVKGWLSSSSGFPGYDPTASYVGLVQEIGTDVPGTDRDHIITDPHNIGAWWPDGSPYGVTLNPSDVWNYVSTLWNKSRPTAWAVLSDIHRNVHALATGQSNLAAGLAGVVGRLDQLQSEVDTLKQEQASVSVNPTDVPAVLHIGSAS